jgi:addiction module HigA family antidote
VTRTYPAPAAVPIIPLETLPQGVHPGYVLDKYIHLARLTQKLAAELMGMTRKNVNLIIREKQGVSLGTAVRLAALFTQTTVEYWRQLQDRYELHHRAVLKRHALKLAYGLLVLRLVFGWHHPVRAAMPEACPLRSDLACRLLCPFHMPS